MKDNNTLNDQLRQIKNNTTNDKNIITKIALVGLGFGLVGGGIAAGGMNWYQNHQAVTTNNAVGTATTSKMNVDVNSQTTKAFNSVKNAVVSVEAYSSGGSSNTIQALLGGNAEVSSSKSEGSGVIYKKADNTAFIVTNNHVISGADKIEIILANGKKAKATKVGTDAVSDLAVLKINAKNVTQVATFGNSNNIKVGETSLAIGSPLGSDYATSLTQGIISAKKRTIDTTGGQATVIQTDAAINPGNSGGPLINLAGQVIGINSMKLSSTGSGDDTTVEGMGFAIPSNEVVSIINDLVKNGSIKRPALGVSVVDLNYVSDSDRKELLKIPESVQTGAVIAKLNDNSPLSKAGIKSYDVITKFDGKEVSDATDLKEILNKHKVGDKVKVEYYHENDKKTVEVTLSLEATEQTNK